MLINDFVDYDALLYSLFILIFCYVCISVFHYFIIRSNITGDY